MCGVRGGARREFLPRGRLRDLLGLAPPYKARILRDLWPGDGRRRTRGGREEVRPMPARPAILSSPRRRGSLSGLRAFDPARVQVSWRRLPGASPREGPRLEAPMGGARRRDHGRSGDAAIATATGPRRGDPRGGGGPRARRSLLRAEIGQGPGHPPPERPSRGGASGQRPGRLPRPPGSARESPSGRRRGHLGLDRARVRPRAHESRRRNGRGMVLCARFERRRDACGVRRAKCYVPVATRPRS